MREIQELLRVCSLRHSHLCPRQVIGVRMALAGAAALGLELPQHENLGPPQHENLGLPQHENLGPPRKDKTLLVIAETDGCFVDGLEVAAGVTPGHRTLRIEDYGKVAATFVNVKSGQALRLAPRPDVRQRALAYAPGEERHYFAQLQGYQVMPEEELFSNTAVILTPAIEQILSRPGAKVCCSACGEEIINEREILFQGMTYCRSCFGEGYYREVKAVLQIPIDEEQVLSYSQLLDN